MLSLLLVALLLLFVTLKAKNLFFVSLAKTVLAIFYPLRLHLSTATICKLDIALG